VLAADIREKIQHLIDAEFKRRSRALPGTVEAKLRRLIADRGGGGHVQVEATTLVAEEMRERAQVWGQMILRVLNNARIAPSILVAEDFRLELQRYANRDIDHDLAALRAKYPQLELDQAQILATRQTEIEKQVGEVPLHLKKREWYRSPVWRAIGGIAAFLAALAALLQFLGINPWGNP